MSDIETLIDQSYSNPNSYHRRLCLISMRQQGFTQACAAGETSAGIPADDRYRAWATESLYTGLIAADEGNLKLALRCALQASKYIGHIGGFWFHNLGDAFSALQSKIEAGLEGNG